MHHKIMFAAAIGLVAILLYVMSVFGSSSIHVKMILEDREWYLQRINLFYRIGLGMLFRSASFSF